MIFLTIGLLIFAAFGKACMDLSSEGKFSGEILNKATSWRNKWKNGDPAQGEKFLGSSTVFVWTTDFWHFSQMVFLTCLFMALVSYRPVFHPVLDFLGLRLIFGVVFEIVYSAMKETK